MTMTFRGWHGKLLVGCPRLFYCARQNVDVFSLCLQPIERFFLINTPVCKHLVGWPICLLIQRHVTPLLPAEREMSLEPLLPG